MNHEYEIKSPKKLIEVALPLDTINKASAREKSIRHGHPSTLHLWWARRPLAAARAVIFSQMVHDPEDLWYYQNPGKEPNKQVRGHWTKARARLFTIIEELVLWENTVNERVVNAARAEIRKSWLETCELNKDHPHAAELFNPENIPGLHDPFAGGGTIPLEAQRLGLRAYASDLNPVAVLINKAMIEIPPRFNGMPPVNPVSRADKQLIAREWKGAEGLAADVRYYGDWMRDEAKKRIGHLYPKVEITDEMVEDRPDLKAYQGKSATVVAWIWARTVSSPSPAFSHCRVPLLPNFILSTKRDNEAYLKPVIGPDGYKFQVCRGRIPAEAKTGTKASARGANFRCILSGSPISPEYIREQATGGFLGHALVGTVAKISSERVFLSATESDEITAKECDPDWQPDIEFFEKALGFRIGNYGMKKWSDLFSKRQLVAMSTFSDLVSEVIPQVAKDFSQANVDGFDLIEYQRAVSTYLAFAVSRAADYWGTGAIWESSGQFIAHVFTRNALPMTWDFPEANPFSSGSGSWEKTCVDWIVRYLDGQKLSLCSGTAEQQDAQTQDLSRNNVVSTDPPYFDNIGYADLSDYFYVWLRKSLRDQYPSLLSTIAVPKLEELVATPARHGGRSASEDFFLNGMKDVFSNLCTKAHPAFPISIYYAFKSSETLENEDTSSTGWVTFLDAIIQSGFSLHGTWPMRTERPGRMRDNASNALASSVILVCKRRETNARSVSRRDFIRELNSSLPAALDAMTRESEDLPSPVAPVDLSQAVIGPGMAVFSKYSSVLEADGSPMTVRSALQLINRFLAEDDFDADTQFCLHWFDQYGWGAGAFGEADVLARAKATSVSGSVDAGVLRSGAGKVQLLKWSDYPANWDPQKDMRIPIWEALHQLIRALRQSGESAAGKLLGYGNVQSRAEAARQLAYRLYTLCERKGWAEDARAYNELITSWSAIESATPQTIQTELFE